MKKFAIAGDGEVARLHAKNIQRGGELVAVCSDEAEALAIELNAKSYTSFDDLLAKEKAVEIVVVCSAVGLHAEHIIKSLQAGKDVLCESPLCLTKAAAWQIIETEKYCGRKVYLIQTPSFFSPFKSINDQWKIRVGNVQSFQMSCAMSVQKNFLSGPNGQQFPGGGLLYKPFGSLIDLLLSLCGEIKTAEGFLKFPDGKTDTIEESGAVALKMENGALGTFNWTTLTTAHPRLSIIGDKGVVEGEIDEPELLLLGADSPLSSKTIEGTVNQLYKAVYDDLFKALSGKNVNFPTTLDGAKTVEAIEKIYKALR